MEQTDFQFLIKCDKKNKKKIYALGLLSVGLWSGILDNPVFFDFFDPTITIGTLIQCLKENFLLMKVLKFEE